MNNLINEETMPVDNRTTASSHETHSDLHWDDDIAEPRCCCVVMYNNLFPKQPKTTREAECLLDEDELAIVTSEFDGTNLPNQQEIMT